MTQSQKSMQTGQMLKEHWDKLRPLMLRCITEIKGIEIYWTIILKVQLKTMCLVCLNNSMKANSGGMAALKCRLATMKAAHVVGISSKYKKIPNFNVLSTPFLFFFLTSKTDSSWKPFLPGLRKSIWIKRLSNV